MSDSSAEGHFTLVGSNIIRDSGSYRISVFSHGYEKEEKLEVGIVSSDKEYKNVKIVTLLGTNMQNLDFELNKLPEGDYNLNVTSLTGEHFDTNRSLHMNTKKHLVLIQTDKSVYKPSDTVQFRVLVLDADTKPLSIDSCDIFITDGADNRVKQFDTSDQFHKGIFANQLQLSDLPVMGEWKIHVKVNGEESIKSFDVDEYVLPTFEVAVDSRPDVTFKDGPIRATVKATYTFGKIAKGTATVSAEVKQNYYYCDGQEQYQKKVAKTVEVDGKKFVEFDIKKDLGIKDTKHEQTIKLTATFKDELSGKEATASTKVKIHVNPVKMELKKSSEKFKPGLPFHVTAVLTSIDKNTPVTDERNPVRFTVTSYYNILRKVKTTTEENVCGRRLYPGENYECWEERNREEKFKVFPVGGTAKIDVNLPIETTQFTVKAEYTSLQEELHRVQKVKSMCRRYIQAKLLNENPLITDTIKVQILSTHDIQELTHQILGSGRILESKHETFQPTKLHTLEVKPTVSMLPKCQVVFHYIAEKGDIISDKLDVEFGTELINQLSLKLSTEVASPGGDLDVTIDTKPGSFVGLLGVDQSVLLLKKGNDIESSTVFEELKKFSEVTKYNYCHYSDSNAGDFADMVLITNAKMASESRTHAYQCAPKYGGRPRHIRLMGARKKKMMMEARADVMMENMAMCDDGVETVVVKPVQVRSKFPETWLFDAFDLDSGCSTKTLTKKVPDTITSWIITGFSLDPLTGLGLTKLPSKLKVFQPFFVSTNLPYSLKRGEVVSVPIIIYNYLDTDQPTIVTLFNNDSEFEFIDGDDTAGKIEKFRKLELTLKSEEGATVNFIIRPLKVGSITIKVTAESPVAGDGIERQLLVEPEGVTQFLNEAVLIDLRTEKEFKRAIDIVVPSEAVPDSTRVEISAVGDILGPSIENLDKLIKLPYGCGEQNMLNFVPNIVILDYLSNLNKLTPAIEDKAKKYMEKGYQRELTYKHNDGSYSAFGKYDKCGSTWLTAFVAKSFHQASKYIKIDQNVILEALNFLKSTQAKDGSFPEKGQVCHQDMQGGSSKGIALTAYVLITFLENQNLSKKFAEVISKAQDYVLENLISLSDTYSLAIASYALQLSGHTKKESLLKDLSNKSVNKDGMKFWQKEVTKTGQPTSVDVEMSAYALQALILADQDNQAVPVMKWLVAQRNENGGFQSTQDTVVGLQALSKLATKIHVVDSDLKITVGAAGRTAEINVNDGNSLVLQKHELPAESRHFEVSASGRGLCLLQVSYRYNLDNSGKFPRFKLEPKVKIGANKEVLMLNVGTSFVPDENVKKSNMAVMEVTLPSGFTYDNDQMAKLLGTNRVKKVETKDGDTVVMIYFDDILETQLTVPVKAYRTHGVAKQKPAPIIIYDYYDNSRCARTFYSIPEISISEIAAA